MVDLSAAEFRLRASRKRIRAVGKNAAHRCASQNLRVPPPICLRCAGGAADSMNYCCTYSTLPVNSITINVISTKRRLVE